MTTINRRRFLMTTGAAATAAGLRAPTILRAQADTIKVGGLHDLSGPLDSSGIPMNQVFNLAIDEINAQGGLLGKQVEAMVYARSRTCRSIPNTPRRWR
ncbi:ABC transporter substrate-binding protein [Salipiger thiooxidans]|uniref:ABC transporter substrate-binding protein n=1 Tax=Salipiger thiooxidans TaxID=282683 RepID=UPI0021E546FC|nr:ABC transporter substrate-binding protein [Salipiger thiooxidans]